jgi:tetratricopeptide (TPR) repeat protein
VSADRDRLIDDLAQAILDGTPIDWPAVDGASADADGDLIAELRLLSAVADLHRSDPDQQDTEPRLSSTSEHRAFPKAWGHLELLERIGGGTFGEVYRAWDTRLDREVAVKLMPAENPADPQVASIIREGRLLAKVRHPGVVTIFDAQQIGDSVGLWMEFVRGRTLEQRLEENGVCDPDEAVEIGIDLCRAVSAVHEAGLLHRDIKTQNVVRADDGRLVLMDFGVGRELTDGSVTDLAGTPLYLAPEVLRDGRADARADIYSIGVLLFHILTRSYPVQAQFVSDLRLVHERQERRLIRTVRPDLPPKVAAVVDRALDPNPGRRYLSAAALREDLHALRPTRRAHARLVGIAVASVFIIGALWGMSRGWLPPGRLGVEPSRAAVIDPRGWLLVGAFSGSTGDSDLEATLRQVVTGELEESPYLNVFPTARLRETLERMERPATSRVDDKLGLEICRREGLAALVTGSVESVDGEYVVTLRATHVPTGRALATTPERHRSREEALLATRAMGRKLRELLGESVASIQATSPPLEPVTSQSFEAVRHFTLGRRLYEEERPKEALPHFLQAINLDPDFAAAHEYAALSYGYLGEDEREGQFLERAAAFALSADSRLGQIEREKILADYHGHFERFYESAAHLRGLLNLRPGDGRVLANLAVVYGSLRQYQSAIDALEASSRVYPHPRVRWMLADMYSVTGQPEKAATLLKQHLDQPYDWIAYSKHLLIGGQPEEAAAAQDEAERQSNKAGYVSWSDLALAKADLARSEGRYRDAEVALRQGLDRGGSAGVERLQLAMASLLLDAGRRREAAAQLQKIDVARNRNRIAHGVFAARAGDLTTAEALLQRLTKDADERKAPRPAARVELLRAEIALARRQAATAHEHAGRAAREFPAPWTLVTLARAQEAKGMIPEAIVTWTSIVESPAERTMAVWDAPAFSQVVLAWYELARLLEQVGRTDEARSRYDDFLRRWERADPGGEVFEDARERRARLAPPRTSDRP